LRDQLKREAEKSVRAYLIFDKIARLEKLEVKKDEHLSKKVMEFLLKEAEWQEEG
jgi:FKBP-type peptidyl-prolyl cis-trans isomerase (trigger factor)